MFLNLFYPKVMTKFFYQVLNWRWYLSRCFLEEKNINCIYSIGTLMVGMCKGVNLIIKTCIFINLYFSQLTASNIWQDLCWDSLAKKVAFFVSNSAYARSLFFMPHRLRISQCECASRFNFAVIVNFCGSFVVIFWIWWNVFYHQLNFMDSSSACTKSF